MKTCAPPTSASGFRSGSFSDHCQRFAEAGANSSLVATLTYGAGWDQPSPRVKHSHTQRKLSPPEGEFITQELQRLLETGAIEQGPASFLSPIRTVPKAGGQGYRMVHDLRAVNKSFTPPSFHLRGIPQLETLVRPTDTFLVVDLKSAFHHIRVAPHLRPYLAFQWQGATYRWTVLPFGWNMSPYIMQSTVDVLASALSSLGLRTSIYLDDALICIPPGFNDPVGTVMQCLRRFGANVALEKGTLTPSRQVRYLGFDICLNSQGLGTVRVPPEKARKLARLLQRLLAEKTILRHELASLVGSLAALRNACPTASGLLRACYKALGPRDRKIRIALSAKITNEAQWWLKALRAPEPLQAYFLLPDPTMTVSTDASRIGWGATFSTGGEIGTPHTSLQGRWKKRQAEALSMGALELLAIKFAARRLPPGRPDSPTVVRLWSDSQNALSALKRGSGSRTMYRIARSVLRLMIDRHIVFLPGYIRSEENILADKLSRFLL